MKTRSDQCTRYDNEWFFGKLLWKRIEFTSKRGRLWDHTGMRRHGWSKTYKNCLIWLIPNKCIFFLATHSIRFKKIDLEQFWVVWLYLLEVFQKTYNWGLAKKTLDYLWGQSIILKIIWYITYKMDKQC
jgi:hypothetical protein